MKKFIGELEDISPSKLIDKNNTKDFDLFFLTLGLIYNDLKGLISLDMIIREAYEQPIDIEPSVHAGGYSGIRLQIEKLLVGLVSEFFIFVRENKQVIKSIKFLHFLKSVDKKTNDGWNELVLIATNPSNSEDFFAKIARIRSNVVFHYNYSGEELANGFVNKFYLQEKSSSNARAYFSFGEKMESTRFFYCDAAIEGYLMEHLKIKLSEKENYLTELMEKVSSMNKVVCSLIYKYLKQK